MQTASDRIKFAVWFSQIDIDKLRPGDLLNLRDDLSLYLGRRGFEGSLEDLGGKVFIPDKHPFPDDFLEKDFKKLQKEVDEVLSGLADAGMTGAFKGIPLSGLFGLIPIKGLDRCIMHSQAAVRDSFLLLLMILLEQQPISPIKRCPECRTIFYRESKRQKYCSRRCANLAATKRWQARQKKAKKGRKKK